MADVRARGRQEIDVETRTFELARVRGEWIVAYDAGFRSERVALRSVGFEE